MRQRSTNYEQRTSNLLLFLLQSEYLILLLCGALILAVSPFTPGLLSSENFINVVGNLAPLLIVAVGMTVVLIAG